MTKKHFIALADAIREHNRINGHTTSELSAIHLGTLANFCQSQNPNFNRERWLGYIAGLNGPNGGSKDGQDRRKFRHFTKGVRVLNK